MPLLLLLRLLAGILAFGPSLVQMRQLRSDDDRAQSREREPFAPNDVLQVPDILLIGAVMAGTTNLYQLLVNNSAICESGEREKRLYIGKDYRKEYRHLVKTYVREFEGCNSSQLTIDAMPGYSAGKYPQVISRMKEHYSAQTMAGKRFIFVLREPVARLYSEYQASVRLCLDPVGDLGSGSGSGSRVGVEVGVGIGANPKPNPNPNPLRAPVPPEDRASRVDRRERACELVVSPKMLRRHQILGEEGGTPRAQDIQLSDLLGFHEWCLTDHGLAEALRGNYRDIIKVQRP